MAANLIAYVSLFMFATCVAFVYVVIALLMLRAQIRQLEERIDDIEDDLTFECVEELNDK